MSTDVLSVDYQHWLKLVESLGVKAFVELTLSTSVREGTEQLLRISGKFCRTNCRLHDLLTCSLNWMSCEAKWLVHF